MNKGLKIGLIIGAVLVIGVLVVKGKEYYDNTYAGSDYYLQVPSDQDTTIDEWQGGQYTIKGKRYKFTAYNEKGESRTVEFDITDSGNNDITEEQLLKPDTHVKVNASKNRVIGWEIVAEQDIPETALKLINENHK
jgi:uncharacterized protein (TIGR01655 family)